MTRYDRLADIQTDLRSGRLSCTDLVDHYLKRIQQTRHLNGFLETFDDEAHTAAKATDAALASGEWKRLTGAVIAIKDVLCYKAHHVSASSRILSGFKSLFTATAVQRLVDAGAIIIGRTNCDEFAMGSSNENSAYGNVLNGLNPGYVPGGSSGGSAVAVQTDCCLAALGTDTGGSVRLPASFCGVLGMKPTYGRISRYGLLAYGSSFDQIGPITRSVEDMAELLEVMAGTDDFDSTASRQPVRPWKPAKTTAPMKAVYIREVLEHPALDEEIRSRTWEVIEWLKSEGHEVTVWSFPYLDYLVPTYYILTTAEASSNLARYDGIHYAYRHPEATDIDSVYRLTRSTGFGAEVKRRIMLGTFVLSAGYHEAYYGTAQKVRRLIHDATRAVFREAQVIITPTAATTAFRVGEKTQDPISMYLSDIFTVQAPLAGIPAVSMPVGRHSNGLPFGIQLMADKFNEEVLLSLSEAIMQSQGALCVEGL